MLYGSSTVTVVSASHPLYSQTLQSDCQVLLVTKHVSVQVLDSKDGDSSSLPSASPTHVSSALFQAMDAYANTGATPFPAASHTPGTATPAQRHFVHEPSPQTTGGQADVEHNLASPLPGSFSRFAVCSAPDVSPYSPMLLRQSEDPRSAAKSDAMMLGSPYQATDSEISFDVAPSPQMGSQHINASAEQNVEVHDRWQMDASTSNSPISYISGPVANRLGSKIHASPSYDPRYVGAPIEVSMARIKMMLY